MTAVPRATAAPGPSTTVSTEDIDMTAADFPNINTLTKVHNHFVGNLLGHLDAALAVAHSPTGGVYPVGTLIQLVPQEAMVKRRAGWNAGSHDWEFFSLDVSPAGTKILTRGSSPVLNRFGRTACRVTRRRTRSGTSCARRRTVAIHCRSTTSRSRGCSRPTRVRRRSELPVGRRLRQDARGPHVRDAAVRVVGVLEQIGDVVLRRHGCRESVDAAELIEPFARLRASIGCAGSRRAGAGRAVRAWRRRPRGTRSHGRGPPRGGVGVARFRARRPARPRCRTRFARGSRSRAVRATDRCVRTRRTTRTRDPVAGR